MSQQGLGATNSSPSDSTGSIGTLHYIEIVNTRVAMYDRTLSAVGSPVDIATFVGATAGGSVFDPQIQWDQQAGRWVYAMDEVYSASDNRLAFGWSKAGDTNLLTLGNTDWCNFHVPTGALFNDYPKLGHDVNFMLIGTNIFNGNNFVSSGVWAIPMPPAGDASCTAPTTTEFGTSGSPLRHVAPVNGDLITTPVPANTTDTGTTAYISTADEQRAPSQFIGVLHVSPIAVGSCVSPPCLVSDGEIPINLWTPGSFTVPQPASAPTIDALDGRLTQAVEHADPQASGAEAVWTQHTWTDASGRTVVTWFELLPSLCLSGFCGNTTERQEGTLAKGNLWLFNAAISPTSHGDAAIIQYNTGSTTTLVDVRAQSRDAADPLGAMSGEFVIRASTVTYTEFTCTPAFGGPPCRWGDYSGASPDPTSCSAVWGSNMLSGDTQSSGAPTWITQNFALSEGNVRSAVSTGQYQFHGSDGQTWFDMDQFKLRLGAAPCVGATGLITANADLFTTITGVNQDIAVFVDVDGTTSTSPLAWKESGGFNGTFSPNAAYVQGIFPMLAGHTYKVRLKWKAAKSNSGSIYAGAGPIGGAFSPTRLTLQLLASPPQFTAMTTQQVLHGSNGTTWTPIPGLTPLTVTTVADTRLVLGGNADLWTDTAGYNQDIGIQVSGGAFGAPPGTVVAWKESGGSSGTFSPNAAFVQFTVNLTATVAYTATLVWKTNHAAPITSGIYVGAGPLPTTTSFSPTSLSGVILPGGTNPFESVTTGQPSMCCNNGSQWIFLGAPSITVQVTVGPTAITNALVTANADLWTNKSGYNQDIAVFVTDNGGTAQMIVWKESGGLGTFSPNAAFAETLFEMFAGHTYVFTLEWKTNRNAVASRASIFAGAGSSPFSPTRLAVELVS